MKIHRSLALLGVAAFSLTLPWRAIAESSSPTNNSENPRERISLDENWRFRMGDPADVSTNVTDYPELEDLAKLQSNQVTGPKSETACEEKRVDIFSTHAGENVSLVQTNYDDKGWTSVNVPHDWAVELPFDPGANLNHGFKAIGDPKFGTNNIAWYRRTFTLPASDDGEKFYLEFDGVYRNCLVWLNGRLLGRNVSGYSGFYFDATPYINPGGENVLVVRVDASRFEGWFYEGAGIYRHVWLTKVHPLHVAPWGTFVHTQGLSGSNATVAIQTEVTNQGKEAASGTLISTIYDADGQSVASMSSELSIPSGKDVVTKQSVSFPANLWSPETPYLYKLVTRITNQSGLSDIYTTPFGVRMVSVDPDKGVFLNGQHMEIKGMCNHQDHAGVGVALPDRLQYYRIERLKQMGANAYRSSHNAPAPETLDACDRMGMLVLDENRRIGTNAEPMSQLTRLIRRDRNHPSVFMWSLGNEEPLQGTQIGAEIVKTMQDAVHSLDPSRLCTIAMNHEWGKGFSSVIDVQGFNYFLKDMDKFHSSFPKQYAIGTETASQVGDRGIYDDNKDKGFVSAYDIKCKQTGWTAPAQEWWPFYHARPWASGGFAWTGFDYRGEPTPYDQKKNFVNTGSHFGTLDSCGFPKDNAFYYQANWTDKPVLHLFPHWNWPDREGKNVSVWVFTNCQEVELFLNGNSLGRKTAKTDSHLEWPVKYTPGVLVARGYRDGRQIAEDKVETAGDPAGITLAPDRSVIEADGRDVSMVTVTVRDDKGNIVPTASNEINFSIQGGKIIGVGNGNPSCHEPDKADRRSAFNGMAQVIVQSTAQPGPITLTASSPGLRSAQVVLTAKPVSLAASND